MNNPKLNFLVQNDINPDIICNLQFQEKLKNWLKEHSFSHDKNYITFGQIPGKQWKI